MFTRGESITTDEEVIGSNPIGCTNEKPLKGGFFVYRTYFHWLQMNTFASS